MQPQELFSKTYIKAREKFQKAAENWGGLLDSYTLYGYKGDIGEKLTMDLAWQGPRDAERLLITTSAVHGVEGHAGSALQTMCLSDRTLLSACNDVAILHVHAFNPYGFSHGRRVNENNVDLNRNFIDWRKPAPADHRLLPMIEAAILSENKGFKKLTSMAAMLRYGMAELQEALTQGQYSRPQALFYGGDQLQWSNSIWQAVIAREVPVRTLVSHMDFHTGLGRHAHAEMILSAPLSSPAHRLATSWWPSVTSPDDKTSVSTSLRGEIANAFGNAAASPTIVPVTLEFGTVASWQVLKALKADIMAVGTKDKRRAQSLMQQAFNPYGAKWRAAVLDQGRAAIKQALQGLSSYRPA
ncbi:MAG: DUF2817 domain-containing protein [Micavibrio sp.]